ncbi:MAG: hypothetical protein ACREXU_12845, partial [Gammaproteobacteria bacterium]
GALEVAARWLGRRSAFAGPVPELYPRGLRRPSRGGLDPPAPGVGRHAEGQRLQERDATLRARPAGALSERRPRKGRLSLCSMPP